MHLLLGHQTSTYFGISLILQRHIFRSRSSQGEWPRELLQEERPFGDLISIYAHIISPKYLSFMFYETFNLNFFIDIQIPIENSLLNWCKKKSPNMKLIIGIVIHLYIEPCNLSSTVWYKKIQGFLSNVSWGLCRVRYIW